MRNRKETAWKKSRQFGDIKGGRLRLKLEDNIFARCHCLKAPMAQEALPVLMQDNPSSFFFFPFSALEIKEELFNLPYDDVFDITHIWLRKIRKKDYLKSGRPLAEFICGSGVRLIVLYPWPKDMRLFLGKSKPDVKILRFYSKWTTNLSNDNNGWWLKWELDALKAFYIGHLLYHEVGHHLDHFFRQWSKANVSKQEEFANQYAMRMSSERTCVINHIPD